MPLAYILVAFIIGVSAGAFSPLAAQQPNAELRLTFLGNAGWEITDGRTVIQFASACRPRC